MTTEPPSAAEFESDWIHKLEARYHWELYWNQVALVEDLVFGREKCRFLEIGIGTGFLCRYLASRGHDVVTVDADENKGPDVVADIRAYKPEGSFDAVLLYEVLEHMPFADLGGILRTLREQCRGILAVSLPDYRRYALTLALGLPGTGVRKARFRLPAQLAWWGLSSRYHHWEVDYKGLTMLKIVSAFSAHGFKLDRHYRYERHYFLRFQVD